MPLSAHRRSLNHGKRWLGLLAGLIIWLAIPWPVWGQQARIQPVSQFGGGCTAVAAQGTLAYCGEGPNLTVMDVSVNPPAVLSKTPLPKIVLGIAVQDNLACVNLGELGIRIFNVSQPAHPRLVGHYDTTPYARQMTLSGHLLLLPEGEAGLEIVDVTDPTAPRFCSRYKVVAFSAVCVAAREGLAYLAGNGGFFSLYVLDLADPAVPRLLGQMGRWGGVTDLILNQDWLYISDTFENDQIHVIDVTNPAAPRLAGECRGDFLDPYLSLAGSSLYLSDRVNGLQVYDLGNPAVPRLQATLQIPSVELEGVASAGSQVFLADRVGGMQVVNVTDPARPVRQEPYDTPGLIMDIKVADGMAYVANWRGGVSVVDLRNPAAPRLRGQYCSNLHAWQNALQILLVGHDALVLNNTGLEVIDVADPDRPVYCASIPTSSYPQLALDGRRLCVAGEKTLDIWDLTEPHSPQKRGSLAITDDPSARFSVAAAAGLAYVLDATGQLHVLDVHDPDHPAQLGAGVIAGRDNAAGDSCEAEIRGSTLYLLQRYSRKTPYPTPSYWQLQMVDVSQPSAPVLLGSYQMDGDAAGLTVAGRHAFVVQGYYGLYVFDVAHPAAPTLEGHYATPGEAYQLTLEGSLVYVADQLGGIQVLRFPFLRVLSPNGPEQIPGGQTREIHWQTDVPKAGSAVRLELWDDQGRVAGLGDDWNAEGEHTLTAWLPLVPEAGDYRIRAISLWDERLWDESDTPFTITGGPVRLYRPAGGETWAAGSEQPAWWQTNPAISGTAVNLELWRVGRKVAGLGVGWDPDGESVTRIQVPAIEPAADYRVRAVSVWNPAWWAESAPLAIRNNTWTPPAQTAIDNRSWTLYQ